jgi:hypothetical protein
MSWRTTSSSRSSWHGTPAELRQCRTRQPGYQELARASPQRRGSETSAVPAVRRGEPSAWLPAAAPRSRAARKTSARPPFAGQRADGEQRNGAPVPVPSVRGRCHHRASGSLRSLALHHRCDSPRACALGRRIGEAERGPTPRQPAETARCEQPFRMENVTALGRCGTAAAPVCHRTARRTGRATAPGCRVRRNRVCSERVAVNAGAFDREPRLSRGRSGRVMAEPVGKRKITAHLRSPLPRSGPISHGGGAPRGAERTPPNGDTTDQ